MKHWILIVSTILAGLYIAKATYQAGLRQFGIAIGIVGTMGWVLIGFEKWQAGIGALVVSFVLFMTSRHLMKKHRIGPFASTPDES